MKITAIEAISVCMSSRTVVRLAIRGDDQHTIDDLVQFEENDGMIGWGVRITAGSRGADQDAFADAVVESSPIEAESLADRVYTGDVVGHHLPARRSSSRRFRALKSQWGIFAGKRPERRCTTWGRATRRLVGRADGR